jgi:ATP synthase protein I
MNEGKEPAPPSDFDARLKEALDRRREGTGKPSDAGGDPRSGLSLALRIGVELVAALIVGAGIGLLLDRWLGTAPWLMVVFFILGAAAGFFNVLRVTKGMGGAVGYTDKDKDKDRGRAPPIIERDDDED